MIKQHNQITLHRIFFSSSQQLVFYLTFVYLIFMFINFIGKYNHAKKETNKHGINSSR